MLVLLLILFVLYFLGGAAGLPLLLMMFMVAGVSAFSMSVNSASPFIFDLY
ncbi:MAG: hypothetical protein IT322_04310 [Anaerolineae bacterium]|nr:hypothetical protein [Anaerolineae bacterium]CAG0945876.1 hypothetical protein ANRL1_02610 [Anaerolineae bacterium]